MPEHFGDLRERGAVADHLRCQTVAKQMCGTPSGASDSGSDKRGANDVAHRGWPGKAPLGWIRAPENTPRAIVAAVIAEVSG